MTEPWETLWDNAMKALDSLEPAFPRKIDWSFGGGTAMRLFYDHRESKDVDIFVTDPYVISGLSPRLNNATQELTDDYNEQSNLLKLRFPEGEVDFIVGGRLIEAVSLAEKHIRGRDVRVEQPIEIVAKSASIARRISPRETSSILPCCSTKNPIPFGSTKTSCLQSAMSFGNASERCRRRCVAKSKTHSTPSR